MKLICCLLSLLLVSAPASTLFPDTESQDDIQVSIVELPPEAAISLLWGKPVDLTTEISRLLESGEATRRTTIGCALDEEGKGYSEEGENVKYDDLLLTSTPNAGPPKTYVNDQKETFVGTRLSVRHQIREKEPTTLQIDLTHHLRPPTQYHWECGPLADGKKLIFPHFHTLKTSSTLLAGDPQIHLIATGKLSGGPTENVFLVFAKQKDKGVSVEPADFYFRAFRSDTITLGTRSREIKTELLRRTGSQDDSALFTRILEDEHRIVSVASACNAQASRSFTNTLSKILMPSGFEPDGGWGNNKNTFIPSNMRIAPNESDVIEVGTSFLSESRANKEDATLIQGEFKLKFDMIPWSTTKLKSNPALRPETDPAAIDAPVVSPAEIEILSELRSGTITLVSSTQRSPPDGEEWLLTFVRSTPVSSSSSARSMTRESREDSLAVTVFEVTDDWFETRKKSGEAKLFAEVVEGYAAGDHQIIASCGIAWTGSDRHTTSATRSIIDPNYYNLGYLAEAARYNPGSSNLVMVGTSLEFDPTRDGELMRTNIAFRYAPGAPEMQSYAASLSDVGEWPNFVELPTYPEVRYNSRLKMKPGDVALLGANTAPGDKIQLAFATRAGARPTTPPDDPDDITLWAAAYKLPEDSDPGKITSIADLGDNPDRRVFCQLGRQRDGPRSEVRSGTIFLHPTAEKESIQRDLMVEPVHSGTIFIAETSHSPDGSFKINYLFEALARPSALVKKTFAYQYKEFSSGEQKERSFMIEQLSKSPLKGLGTLTLAPGETSAPIPLDGGKWLLFIGAEP